MTQYENSVGTMLLGKVRFGGVDFEGTIYVDDPNKDQDSVGFVFCYQVLAPVLT